ncbi:ABC transporter substrate-binding protein [Microbacterium sp. YY-01]|uniref:ABC transporter substrate-binding protein n=1 Tax=Microbacterium sp. YY-01 TaxID=3421634 RepID=UPI003D17871A
MSSLTPRRLAKPALAAFTLIASGALVLTGCSGGGGGATSSPDTLEYVKNAENTTTEPVLKALASGSCSAENDALPLEVSSIPQADIDSQMQLMASQGGLPPMFAAGDNPAEGKKLWEAGVILDLDEALTDLGKRDSVAEGAVSTIEKLYGGAFNFLPFQYNIEGIWYNKSMFAENGWEIPETWDELDALAGDIKDAGFTPFSASGEQGWPLTRLVSGYLFRDLGGDALQKVADGEAKLTDPEYVAAAEKIAEFGAKGYFGANVTSLDMDSSYNEFFTGKAAMIYMGSWILGNINNPEANQIGADNVGLMKLPAVEGGAGSIDAYPANVGVPSTFGSKTYSDEVADWLGCIADNYGNEALEQGQITGFVTDAEVDLPEITQVVADEVAASTDSVLWFEALFNAKASQVSSNNAALLVTGQISAEEFMTLVQDALDN